MKFCVRLMQVENLKHGTVTVVVHILKILLHIRIHLSTYKDSRSQVKNSQNYFPIGITINDFQIHGEKLFSAGENKNGCIVF